MTDSCKDSHLTPCGQEKGPENYTEISRFLPSFRTPARAGTGGCTEFRQGCIQTVQHEKQPAVPLRLSLTLKTQSKD